VQFVSSTGNGTILRTIVVASSNGTNSNGTSSSRVVVAIIVVGEVEV